MKPGDETYQEEAHTSNLHRQMTRSGSFYKDFELDRNRKKVQEEVQRVRARLEAKVKEKERIQYELEEKRRKEKELQKLRQLEAWKKEQEWKTKRYFEHNKFQRKIGIEGDPTYFGDFEMQSTSWRPHGKGKFIMNNITIVEGNYVHGELTEGKVIWKDFYQWEGMLWKNKIHGMGIVRKLRQKDFLPKDQESDSEDSVAKRRKAKAAAYAKRYQTSQQNSRQSTARSFQTESEGDHSSQQDEYDDDEDPKQYEPREAIANQGEIVCYRDELIEGLQIEFLEPIFNNYMTMDGHLPRVTLIKFIKDWKYLCRFHQETWPRERVIDFCRYNRFRLLRHLPRILDIHSLALTPDALRIYDFRQQEYITSILQQSTAKSKEEGEEMNTTSTTSLYEDTSTIAKKVFSYQNRTPVVPGRPFEDRRKNMFESREVGIGQAQEEDDIEEKERLKKLQWAKVLAERKAKFFEKKQQMYADEQRKQLESAAASKRRAQEEEESLAKELTKTAVESELQRIEDEYSRTSTASVNTRDSV